MRPVLLSLWLVGTILPSALALRTGAQTGAVIKKANGQLVRGDIQGTVLQMELRHPESGHYAGLYVKVPGEAILSIDERGVRRSDSSRFRSLLLTQKDSIRNLELLTAWPERNGLFQYAMAHQASFQEGVTTLNPHPALLAGELRFLDARADIVPAIRVKTAQGFVTIPIVEIIAFKPGPAP